ncbi:MAG: hypothetical protein QGH20_08780, partial [Candidatus Latescibacteria bacterium]|nr:hypothetical protein [Candidatus Latescibacterota bacterium]
KKAVAGGHICFSLDITRRPCRRLALIGRRTALPKTYSLIELEANPSGVFARRQFAVILI